ncbi:glutathione S-transferase A1-like [Amphiura filiformis]|uniref:glutathione S-transferase A1-like n=1 Tax=Amphiura filiformis TaxID=82378 RepID=UPI003B20C6CB
MSKANIIYFDSRGKAEAIRLMLAAAGIEWEEEHLNSKERVEEIRKDGRLIFEQFPLLEIDGVKISQSMAAVRYLADKHDLMGKTLLENVRINMLADGARDWLALGGFTGLMFQPAEKREAVKAASLNKSRTRYLPAFDKALKENGSNGYLVGDKLTMADLLFLDVLTWVWEFDEDLVTQFPAAKDFLNKVRSLPNIKSYLEGPQRHGQPDEEYAKMVNHILY